MKKNSIIIYFFTAVFLVVVLFVTAYRVTNLASLPFSVKVHYGGETETIKCWENDEDECYVFLPSFLKFSDVKIALNTENNVSVDGKDLYENMTCEAFSPNTQYDLIYRSFGKKITKKITFMQSANIPAMYIDTESEGMDYIHSEKGNKEQGELRVYDGAGALDFKGALAEINGRGNSTWKASEKKPYNLTFSNDVDLLSMGEATEWVLLSNSLDESNLRNKLVYDFSKTVGVQSPECEWVDLYLNGEYAGLYLLCERNEIGDRRLDISEEKSFLVSLESLNKLTSEKKPYVLTENGQALRIHSSYLNNEALAQKWQSVENAILSKDGIDNISGKHWRDLIDTDSWARKYLIEEIFGNFDACFTSQYFYCDDSAENNKIFAGPVWDFDLSIGFKDTWQIAAPNILVANRGSVGNGYETPWFHSLYNQSEFKGRVTELYENEFLLKLQEFIHNDLATYALHINQASELNSVRWHGGDAKIHFEQITEFLEKRLMFLNDIWINDINYHTVRFISSANDYDGYYVAYHGQPLSAVPFSADDENYSAFIGWYRTDTDELFDTANPIYEDIEVYAKWQDSENNKVDNILKLLPLAVIAGIFMILLIVEIRRIKSRG